jgi:hypothetical protein
LRIEAAFRISLGSGRIFPLMKFTGDVFSAKIEPSANWTVLDGIANGHNGA